MTPEEIARNRIAHNRDDICFAMKKAMVGNPFGGETDHARRRVRLQSKLNLTPKEAEVIDDQVTLQMKREFVPFAAADELMDDLPPEAARVLTEVRSIDDQEKIWGDTVDFVNVAFLEKGAAVARSVGRVAFKNGRSKGSGVLIGERLFLTNHHVLQTAKRSEKFVVEFDYERDLFGRPRDVSRFELDASLFVTDSVEGLDFTIIGVGQKIDGKNDLSEFGLSGLSDAADKHMIGEFANIVQHPSGRFKEVVLRENRLVGRYDDCLHYVADTEPGSSGSPVYNSEWQLIALHHWGGPWIDGPVNGVAGDFDINEGIRISSIVRKLKRRLRYFPPETARRISAALDTGESFIRKPDSNQGPGHAKHGSAISTEVKIETDGRVTWTIPVELSVRLPGNAADQSVTPNEIKLLVSDEIPKSVDVSGSESTIIDYDDRDGYNPSFLPGFTVPLPQLTDQIIHDSAILLDDAPGENRRELKYHHFSVVMNGRRRMAFYTACNIDGKTARSIKRAKDRNAPREVDLLQPGDRGLFEAFELLDNAESESWEYDPRILRSQQIGKPLYDNQRVPGFPRGRDPNRINRMFQKGHLVRRIDPAWGDDEDRAIEAEIDTFHWTNAAPQVGFFNMGRADADQVGTGNGNLWRAAENFVLRNAVSEDRQRVTSFTGPVFRDDDKPYRDIQIPGAFFKVTAWVDDGELKSLALLVDQSQVFREWPEGIGTAEFAESATEEEAFQDPKELERVDDFLSTVQHIESLTGLDFGESMRAGDIRKGEEIIEVTPNTDLPFGSTNGSSQPGEERKDDLTLISGLGRTFEHRLNTIGVFRFKQIAGWSTEQADTMGDRIGAGGRIRRDDWIGQAQNLAN